TRGSAQETRTRPSAAFNSSQAPLAAMRGSVFETRRPKRSAVVPSSPVLVAIDMKALFEVKGLGQGNTCGTVVRIRIHDVAHVFPPPSALGRLRDGRPSRFILNFRVREQLK